MQLNALNNLTKLKIAAILLFWFGVWAQSVAVFILVMGYGFKLQSYQGGIPLVPLQDIHGNLDVLGSVDMYLNVLGFQGVHFTHIVSAYWLSKGRKKGWVVAIAVSIYEIVSFLTPTVDPGLFTPYGFAIRVLFAIIIFLSISGRKKLIALRYENWRPWKNPKTTQTYYPALQHEKLVAPVSKVRIITGILLMSAGTIQLLALSKLSPVYNIELFNLHNGEFTILGIAGIVIGIYMLERWERPLSLFVCGECNLTFLAESDLRNHNDTEHAKD